MKKNDILNVDIVDIGINFEGIAKLDSFVIFIPNVLLNENVDIVITKINKNFGFGRVIKIVKKSEYRIDSICDVSNKCGGCDLQHIDYSYSLKLKYNLVKNILDKQKINYLKLFYTIGMDNYLNYRNKVIYPVRNNKIGFYRKNSHDIIENSNCFIESNNILVKNIFLNLIKHFTSYNEESNTGDIRNIIIRTSKYFDEVLVIIVVNNIIDKKIIYDIFKKFNVTSGYININNNKTNEVLGDTTIHIYGDKYIKDSINNYIFYIGPTTFFQVNTLQTEVLYSKLNELLKLNNTDILFDLYSGIGTIGIYLSKFVDKVYGIEINCESVKLANMNILKNNIKNAEYIAGDVKDKIEEYNIRNIHPSVIVVDPPRKGLGIDTINNILKFKPNKIGYISCNPITLANDLKLFTDYYTIDVIVPVDMFPMTKHVECVCVMKLR
ncbi:MAG: 23S rRNA (uracil(1939)-C(5))-methyltransferase RlmD [Clostridia bacterium]